MAEYQAGNPNRSREERGGRQTGGLGASKNAIWPIRKPGTKGILDDMAKDIVGDAGMLAGLLPGAARGMWHTGEDVYDGVNFLAHLAHPNEAKRKAAWEGAARAGNVIVDYAKNAISHPEEALSDVGDSLRGFRAKIDPAASPAEDSVWGELQRNFDIGLNRGEAAFDAASLLVGGGEVKALAKLVAISKGAGAAAKGAGVVSKEARAAAMAAAAALKRGEAAKFRARGYPEKVAKHFAEPYDGMGSHFIPRRTKLPALLGGGPVPPAILDSRFFLLKPPNMSKGDFYELHFQVDPKYYGGPIGADFGGGGWSGRKLGWTKRGRAGRIWYGSPRPLKKAVAGAGMFGAGAAVDQFSNGEGQP